MIRYVRSPLSDLKDSTLNPAFFIAPAMNPRTVCFCQPIVFMISVRVAPFLRWSMETTWAVLVPSRGPSALGFADFLGDLAALLAWVAFLGLAAGGALGLPPLAALWPLGAPSLGLAPFFEEGFCGATVAPCAATAAEVMVLVSVVAAFSVVIFVCSPSAGLPRQDIHHSGAPGKQVDSAGFGEGDGMAMGWRNDHMGAGE